MILLVLDKQQSLWLLTDGTINVRDRTLNKITNTTGQCYRTDPNTSFI